MQFLIRLLLNAAALWVAVRLVSGITFEGTTVAFLGVALVFTVVNAVVKPILQVLSIPFILVTLGFFLLVVNAFVLWMTSGLSGALGLGFQVRGFGAAFLGALVVSLVNLVLSWIALRP
jgi:putative membrane protein